MHLSIRIMKYKNRDTIDSKKYNLRHKRAIPRVKCKSKNEKVNLSRYSFRHVTNFGPRVDGEEEEEVCNIYVVGDNIYFNSGVDRNSIELLERVIAEKCDEFKKLEVHNNVKDCKPRPLYLHITSSGGSFVQGLKGYDIIRNSIIPINTIINGFVASAATILSLAGVNRYITKNSYVLVHEINVCHEGNFRDILDEMSNTRVFMNKLVDIYLTNTKLKKPEVLDSLRNERVWTAGKCMKVGLANKYWKGK